MYMSLIVADDWMSFTLKNFDSEYVCIEIVTLQELKCTMKVCKSPFPMYVLTFLCKGNENCRLFVDLKKI